jgi:hypothetical protein
LKNTGSSFLGCLGSSSHAQTKAEPAGLPPHSPTP